MTENSKPTKYVPGERVDGVYTREGEPGTIDVSLTFPTRLGVGADKTPFVSLSFSDQVSGVLIAELEISGADFTGLLSGSHVVVKADHMTRHPERIGKRAQNTSTKIPDASVPKGVKIEDMAHAVEQTYLRDGWDEAYTQKHNDGVAVIARRWVDA